jgi:hypothetical protein
MSLKAWFCTHDLVMTEAERLFTWFITRFRTVGALSYTGPIIYEVILTGFVDVWTKGRLMCVGVGRNGSSKFRRRGQMSVCKKRLFSKIQVEYQKHCSYEETMKPNLKGPRVL